MVKRSDELENGCIPMHCGARGWWINVTGVLISRDAKHAIATREEWTELVQSGDIVGRKQLEADSTFALWGLSQAACYYFCGGSDVTRYRGDSQLSHVHDAWVLNLQIIIISDGHRR